jgi:hypothetical protein
MIALELILLILFIAPIILFLFFVIKSFIIRYNAKKLSDINKIIKEVKISEIQKIENVKYTPIPTLDQRDKISEKFLNSDLIRRSKISRIEMEDVFEGEIESVPFISADLSVYERSSTYRELSLSGTYYYFDIPTIEKGVDIVLVPRPSLAVFIFFILYLLLIVWYTISVNEIAATLVLVFVIALLIVSYFSGSKTENGKFNSYFVLQTNDKIKAKKILTPAVIQSIIDLREKEGEIMIAIKEGQLHIVIKNKDRFYNKSTNDLTKMKENIAQHVRQEIDLIKRLLKSTKL